MCPHFLFFLSYNDGLLIIKKKKKKVKQAILMLNKCFSPRFSYLILSSSLHLQQSPNPCTAYQRGSCTWDYWVASHLQPQRAPSQQWHFGSSEVFKGTVKFFLFCNNTESSIAIIDLDHTGLFIYSSFLLNTKSRFIFTICMSSICQQVILL